jgi:hypothetical protein
VSADSVQDWLGRVGLLTPWPSADRDEAPALAWLASPRMANGPAPVAIPLQEASVLQWVQTSAAMLRLESDAPAACWLVVPERGAGSVSNNGVIRGIRGVRGLTGLVAM